MSAGQVVAFATFALVVIAVLLATAWRAWFAWKVVRFAREAYRARLCGLCFGDRDPAYRVDSGGWRFWVCCKCSTDLLAGPAIEKLVASGALTPVEHTEAKP